MDDNAAATNWLLKAVIIHDRLRAELILLPDLDTEGVQLTITSPEHEAVIPFAIDSTTSLELSVGTILINNQPILADAVEVKVCNPESELCIAFHKYKTNPLRSVSLLAPRHPSAQLRVAVQRPLFCRINIL